MEELEPLQQLQEQLKKLAVARQEREEDVRRLQKCQAKVTKLAALTTQLMQARESGPARERAEGELQATIAEALALQSQIRKHEKVQAEEAISMHEAAARMHQLLHEARPRVPAEG